MYAYGEYLCLMLVPIPCFTDNIVIFPRIAVEMIGFKDVKPF